MIFAVGGGDPTHEFIYFLENELTRLRIENWLHRDLFSYQWWLLIATLIIPWLIWWKWVNKTKLIEITLFGTIVFIIAFFLDATMSEMGLWEYNFYVIPYWPRLITADFSIIPVTYMFIYQYFKQWKNFLTAMLGVSIFFAFVGEPLLVWLNIYTLHKWRHVYSLPIYFGMAVLVKYLTQLIIDHNE